MAAPTMVPAASSICRLAPHDHNAHDAGAPSSGAVVMDAMSLCAGCASTACKHTTTAAEPEAVPSRSGVKRRRAEFSSDLNAQAAKCLLSIRHSGVSESPVIALSEQRQSSGATPMQAASPSISSPNSAQHQHASAALRSVPAATASHQPPGHSAAAVSRSQLLPQLHVAAMLAACLRHAGDPANVFSFPGPSQAMHLAPSAVVAEGSPSLYPETTASTQTHFRQQTDKLSGSNSQPAAWPHIFDTPRIICAESTPHAFQLILNGPPRLPCGNGNQPEFSGMPRSLLQMQPLQVPKTRLDLDMTPPSSMLPELPVGIGAIDDVRTLARRTDAILHMSHCGRRSYFHGAIQPVCNGCRTFFEKVATRRSKNPHPDRWEACKQLGMNPNWVASVGRGNRWNHTRCRNLPDVQCAVAVVLERLYQQRMHAMPELKQMCSPCDGDMAVEVAEAAKPCASSQLRPSSTSCHRPAG